MAPEGHTAGAAAIGAVLPRGRVPAFAALAQAGRLDIFRLLINLEPGGASSGEIARCLRLRHNVVSRQLRSLVSSGLVSARAERGEVRFSARLEALGALFDLRQGF